MLTDIFFEQCVHYSRVESGFLVNRPGGPGYIAYVHFYYPMRLLVNGALTETAENTFIFFERHSPQHYFPLHGVMLEDWMHFDSDAFSSFAHGLGIPLNTPFAIDNNEEVTEIFKELANDFHMKDLHWRSTCSVRLNLLLYKIAEGLQADKSAGLMQKSVKQDFVDVRKEIAGNPRFPWTITAMAERLNYSSSHFCLLYKKLFHVSPKQDLLIKRLELAKYLLGTTSLSIEEISSQLCYHTSTSFISSFTKQTGMSPLKFRHGNK